MTFGQSVKHVFSNYATFQGRASRSEFWWWYLFTAIISLIVFIPAMPWYIDFINAANSQTGNAVMVLPPVTGLAAFGLILSTVWSLAVLIPTIAVAVRRLHDTNKSGWWMLLWFLSCCFGIGAIILIIFWVMASTPGPNRFGEGPARAA
ncbi:MAG: hypothetical protein RL134_1159 [Actinomycetota bacterium]|jgi:uncharacterized membrane protein YhaH (DUF805 family)